MGTFLRGTLRLFSIAMGVAALVWAQEPLVINPTTLPYAGVGQNYSVTLDAYGGIGPFSWSVNSSAPGSLPAGVSLSPNGLLSGIPSEPGVYFLQVDVAGPDPKERGTATLGLVVVEINSPASLGTTQAGTAFSTQLSVNAVVQNVTWGLLSGNLPPGVSISSSGRLSGTPTQAAERNQG